MINTLARSFYYPSLGYNVILEKIGYTKWWNAITIKPEDGGEFPVVLLGALPFSSQLARFKAEGVTRVVSMNEKHELKSKMLRLPSVEDYKAFEIERYQVDVCDFTGAPTIEQIDACLDFIQQSKGKVYVHCKAGRCRSAVIVTACKIKYEKKTPREAFNEIKAIRHHIVFHNIQWRRMEEYFQHCKNC